MPTIGKVSLWLLAGEEAELRRLIFKTALMGDLPVRRILGAARDRLTGQRWSVLLLADPGIGNLVRQRIVAWEEGEPEERIVAAGGSR